MSIVKVLHGHVTPEHAYVVNNYPYGRLRCTMRYWLETASKGAGKGQTRMMRQSTNPKKPGNPWNKPHSSTYADIMIMYLDEQGHVQQRSFNRHIYAQEFQQEIFPVLDQLSDEQKDAIETLVRKSCRCSPDQWTEFFKANPQYAVTIAGNTKLSSVS